MNSLLTIQPYKPGGVWIFDDASLGVRREPFVGDINTMIDYMCIDAGIHRPEGGFTATFGAIPFPGAQMKLDLVSATGGGAATYRCNKYDLEGWLCPCLGKYLSPPPDHIYVRADAIRRSCWERTLQLLGL